MHGCGNDYIYIYLPNGEDGLEPGRLALALAPRNKGIGGDGIVLILPPLGRAEARMRMFNADGSEGRMCGNAIRCVAKYLYDNRIAQKSPLLIETLSGTKELELIIKDGAVHSVTVDMGPPILVPGEIPVKLPGGNVVSHPVEIGGKNWDITCVSMGNPHAVVFVEDTDGLNLHGIGPLFENSPIFPDRINTEFVKILSPNRLRMRVWERGSGETLACGTGACAAAVAAILCGYCKKNEDITVELLGGELTIRWDGGTVYMTGEAVSVFSGVIDASPYRF